MHYIHFTNLRDAHSIVHSLELRASTMAHGVFAVAEGQRYEPMTQRGWDPEAPKDRVWFGRVRGVRHWAVLFAAAPPDERSGLDESVSWHVPALRLLEAVVIPAEVARLWLVESPELDAIAAAKMEAFLEK